MNRFTLVLAAVLAGAVPAFAQTTSADGAASDSAAGLTVTNDADFVKMATSSNLLEIKSSQMAQERAQADGVKAFAEKMIADHTAASQKLAEAAGTAPPDLSGDVSAMMQPAHAQLLAELEAAEGAAFDTAYAKLQLQAHEQAVALFQTYATNGQEGAVKQFAADTLPTLQEHFNMAKEMQPQQ